MAKNYLEHEDEVKFYENYLNKSKEWQTFIDLLEENFEIRGVNSFDEYFDQCPILNRLFSHFIEIIKCNPNNSIFNKQIFKEIYSVAEFYLGKKEKEIMKASLTNDISKVLFVITWITKLENVDNGTNYIFDARLLTQNNIWIILKIDTLILNEEEILDYLDLIKINGLDIIKKTFADNVNKVMYPPDITFLENHRDEIVQVNAFDFKTIRKPKNSSWEINYILDMLMVNIDNRKLIPMFEFGESATPDTKQWTVDILNQVKEYFNCDISDFVIDSIKYVLYKIRPSDSIIDMHIELFIDNYNTTSTITERYYNSTFKIISYLIEDKYIDSTNGKKLFKKISTIDDLEELKVLNEYNIPINQVQKRKIKEFYRNCYLILDIIKKSNEYSEYLLDMDIVKSINNDYLFKCSKMFDKFIDNDDRLCAKLFIDYMRFLIRTKSNASIDKEFVQSEMIRIQELWENQYYDVCCSKLQSFNQELQIDQKIIEKYNDDVLKNIFIIAHSCVISKKQDYISTMELASKNPLIYEATRIIYSKHFPITEGIEIQNHEIDELTLAIIRNIKEEYGYRFLNKLDDEVYIRAIHETMIQKAQTTFQFFYKIEELYNMVCEKIKDEYELIKFDKNIKLAHLTQLFPIIELMIKKIGKIYNVFPYKEDENKFMQSKDPSSILRILLQKAYDETNGFEVVSDLLFIYNYLYNGNSLNVRNECIHGRNYLKEGALMFAFKIALASLYMLIRRLEVVTSNIDNNS